MRVRYASLENWQSDKPFVESKYGHRPSSNGLDMANPGFAFTSNLTKYIRNKSCLIVDGNITDIRYED